MTDPTNAQRQQFAQQRSETRQIRLDDVLVQANQRRFLLLRLRMPDKDFGAVFRTRLNVSQLKTDAFEEFVLFVAGPIRHRGVWTARQIVKAHRESGHIDGPLTTGRPGIVKTDHFALRN